MGDWMAYAYPREEDKMNTDATNRLDIWFISNKLFKPTKRVTFRRCTKEKALEIVNKAVDVVELFGLYDDIQFALSDDMIV